MGDYRVIMIGLLKGDTGSSDYSLYDCSWVGESSVTMVCLCGDALGVEDPRFPCPVTIGFGIIRLTECQASSDPDCQPKSIECPTG